MAGSDRNGRTTQHKEAAMNRTDDVRADEIAEAEGLLARADRALRVGMIFEAAEMKARAEMLLAREAVAS